MKKITCILLVLVSWSTLAQNKSDNRQIVYGPYELTTQPKFPGGLNALYDHIYDAFNIPDGVNPDVTMCLSFVVDTDGTVTNVKVLRDPGNGLGAEAIKAIESTSGKWSPGLIDDKLVRGLYYLPFKVNAVRVPAIADQSKVYAGADLDIQPEYPGGKDALYRFIGNTFRTPEIDEDISVVTIVSFIIEKDGSIWGIRAKKDPGYGLGDEAEKVMYTMPEKWSPGIKNGKPVRTLYSLPIQINITSSK